MADGFFSNLKDRVTDAAGAVADTTRRRGAEATGEKVTAATKAVTDTSRSIASSATAQARTLLKWSESGAFPASILRSMCFVSKQQQKRRGTTHGHTNPIRKPAKGY